MQHGATWCMIHNAAWYKVRHAAWPAARVQPAVAPATLPSAFQGLAFLWLRAPRLAGDPSPCRGEPKDTLFYSPRLEEPCPYREFPDAPRAADTPSVPPAQIISAGQTSSEAQWTGGPNLTDAKVTFADVR